MSASYNEFYVQLINMRTGRPIDDDTGVYNVLTANDPAEITIYSDDKGTSKSNPATMTDGILHFWTVSTVTSVDVSLLTATGHAAFIEGLTLSQHRYLVDPEKTEQQLIVPYLRVGASESTIIPTGFAMNANMVIKDCYVHVTTATTLGELDIGTSADTDGFYDAVSVSATGWVFPDPTDASAHILGALLSSTTSAAQRKLYSTSASNLTYTTESTTGTVGAGYIYYIYSRIPA
jgi:hypothetical protein